MGHLKLIFKLSAVLTLLCFDLCSSLICREGSISWNRVCLNATYITSSDISIDEICSNYPAHCLKKLPYYFKCGQTSKIKNPVLIDNMCVDGTIAYCHIGGKLLDGLCTFTYKKIRRTFLYTVNMDTLDLPSPSEYEKMQPKSERPIAPFYRYYDIFANGTWKREESPGIKSQLSFIKNFHFFKNSYPGLQKIRVQIIESSFQSENDIDYRVDPLSRWLGIPLISKQKTIDDKPITDEMNNLKFDRDINVVWELNDAFILPTGNILPSFQHLVVDQPIILPLIYKVPPKQFIPTPSMSFDGLNSILPEYNLNQI